ncbi:hypothetical protein E1A91_D05G351600v1 [Gossypium mustelinum]|uniref:Uncharacterized protein n=2 Tax=Gossypium TaxID=3633 RepID=A0A5D2V4P4_GOSMU|nr:hypothetical protein ES332_D05G364500v1 [Gossypium tomentosum]TYI84250.1 hypothetical protein E1A91_D05G351600v1 [Gossypium mustelinum]
MFFFFLVTAEKPLKANGKSLVSLFAIFECISRYESFCCQS